MRDASVQRNRQIKVHGTDPTCAYLVRVCSLLCEVGFKEFICVFEWWV